MNRRKARKTFPLRVREDPSLWRFTSLAEALAASTDVIARLIHAGEERSKDAQVLEAPFPTSKRGAA